MFTLAVVDVVLSGISVGLGLAALILFLWPAAQVGPGHAQLAVATMAAAAAPVLPLQTSRTRPKGRRIDVKRFGRCPGPLTTTRIVANLKLDAGLR